jgi:pyruvate,orthophosphate dikinase
MMNFYFLFPLALRRSGNKNDNCGTGVGFTRNPANGENLFYGEYLLNAQGEDVVAGVRTPEDLVKMKQRWPNIYNELVQIRGLLEKEYRDMQDIEFTIEDGKL